MPKVPTKSKKPIATRQLTLTGAVIGESSSEVDNISAEQTIEQSLLDNLEQETMEKTWFTALEGEFSKSYFTSLKRFLRTEHASSTIYPPLRDVYSWSRLTPLSQVKVAILGQDPYHDVGQAHGLAFSVLPPTRPPPSLKNIYKQLGVDIPGFVAPQTGDLSAIASQGVLWLNTCLTVRAHAANSHSKKGWETFTMQALRAVLEEAKKDDRGIVFILWGKPAQDAVGKLSVNEKKHLLLKSAHPSPLSASRGFHGNEHFKKANEWLREQYGENAMIDWTVLNPSKAT